ncbi:MAG: DUF1523 family protein [Methylocapsa sp.]|nr:DUF1523 family protein [Methylocapsa sp.]
MAINLRRIWLPAITALVFAAPAIAILDYFLPHHLILKMVGTDVKRVSGSGRADSQFDIRYIYSEDIDTKKPRVFRNEDTGWGFPWYFKFNSSDVQAAARAISNEGGTAAITYYGWRIQLFSMYPNVIKIKRADPGTAIIPWFNIAFFTVVIGGALWLALWIRGIRKRRSLAREGARSTQRD